MENTSNIKGIEKKQTQVNEQKSSAESVVAICRLEQGPSLVMGLTIWFAAGAGVNCYLGVGSQPPSAHSHHQGHPGVQSREGRVG